MFVDMKMRRSFLDKKLFLKVLRKVFPSKLEEGSYIVSITKGNS